MKYLTIEEIRRTFEADEIIDCGDVLVALRFPEGMSSDEIQEMRREIMKMKLDFEIMNQRKEKKD